MHRTVLPMIPDKFLVKKSSELRVANLEPVKGISVTSSIGFLLNVLELKLHKGKCSQVEIWL